MTFGKTVLCQKDLTKHSAVDKYRPISCLTLMWKLMTGMLVRKRYSHHERENVLPSERKGCHLGSHGTKDQLLTDKTVLRDCKRRHTNLAITWIDPITKYLIAVLEMFGTVNNIQDFLYSSMKSWKLGFNASGGKLGEVDIR